MKYKTRISEQTKENEKKNIFTGTFKTGQYKIAGLQVWIKRKMLMN